MDILSMSIKWHHCLKLFCVLFCCLPAFHAEIYYLAPKIHTMSHHEREWSVTYGKSTNNDMQEILANLALGKTGLDKERNQVSEIWQHPNVKRWDNIKQGFIREKNQVSEIWQHPGSEPNLLQPK